jgi:tetratricopeptide (TPR) repeat protein
MKRPKIALLVLFGTCYALAHSPISLARQSFVAIDWRAELARAKAGIEKDPSSAQWHHQAGTAYFALNDFENATKEFKVAYSLDPSNPNNDYSLYALYKRKGMHSEQRQALLDALEKDPNNPVGHFEFGSILEVEEHWADSLREYQNAKRLAEGMKGPVYTDQRGNPYGIATVREKVDKAIKKVSILNDAAPAK